MRLIGLEIRKLYGSLDKDVVFNPDLNLLVGINGSGKTSVLNAIDWLLRLDNVRLATTSYKRITLKFHYKGKDMTLEAVQTKSEVNLHLKGEGTNYAPYNIRLHVPPSEIASEAQLAQLARGYSTLEPEKKELPFWNAMKALPKPTVITLDRTISAEVAGELYDEPDLRPRRPQQSARTPLAQVLRVATNRHTEYRSKVANLNEVLKARLVMSALRVPDDPTRSTTKARILPKDIEKLEQKVIAYVATAFSGTDVGAEAAKFFRRIKSISAKSAGAARTHQGWIWAMLSGRFEQIEDLAGAFNEFETQSSAAYETLRRYLEVVNRFLKESRKQIVFNESTSALAFQFLKEDGTPEKEFRDVRYLSSGERQVLILLTFLAFVEDPERVFIVDEPELSLHPKWQSEFMDAFLALKPRETQLLMATHSPDIVGEHKESCVVLLPH